MQVSGDVKLCIGVETTQATRADPCSLVCMSKAIRFGFGGVTLIVLGLMSATERLPRNLFAGIRIPSTLRSDDAWRAGHRAAASALTTAGLGPVVVSVIAAAKKPSGSAQSTLFRIGSGWLLAWLGLATIQASRA